VRISYWTRIIIMAGPGGFEPSISGLEGLHVDVVGGVDSVPYPNLATGPHEINTPVLIRLTLYLI
jgi:hypothetical protein